MNLHSHATSTLGLACQLLLSGATLALAGCGGGGDADAPAAALVADTGGDIASAPASTASIEVRPTFHMAPLTLDEPAGVDADGSGTSAHEAPHVQQVPASMAGVDSAGLTVKALGAHRAIAQRSVAPQAAGATVTVYTPAQIRAAYQLPALPTSMVGLSAAAAASLGAGQTVYIVDAMHNPKTLDDLNAFSRKFGLPTCNAVAVAPTARLPLAAATTAAGCTLGIVYTTAAGAMTATAPAYNAGWASEIALDVQWVHATAPLARIVLIEAPDASVASLGKAVQLANAMGPGVVSMSFGGTEGNWTASVDASFTAAGMTYVAATGDAGAQVSWPAVSTNVLAVGGTSLTYTGNGARSEVVWSKTGGGVSAFTALPAYQTGLSIAGTTALKKRGVADVAFNADPMTGQYVALTTPGTTTPGWYAFGGTSLATPQWAALVAIANAVRATTAKAPLGAVQTALYSRIAAVGGLYAGAFADVLTGADGSCATCKAGRGYDLPTGLGTPKFESLLPLLAAN